MYLFGFVGPEWSRVRAVTGDGTTIDAVLFEPPHGSLLRGHFFVATLPQGTDVRAVEALQPDNDQLRRSLRDEPPCGNEA